MKNKPKALKNLSCSLRDMTESKINCLCESKLARDSMYSVNIWKDSENDSRADSVLEIQNPNDISILSESKSPLNDKSHLNTTISRNSDFPSVEDESISLKEPVSISVSPF